MEELKLESEVKKYSIDADVKKHNHASDNDLKLKLKLGMAEILISKGYIAEAINLDQQPPCLTEPPLGGDKA